MLTGFRMLVDGAVVAARYFTDRKPEQFTCGDIRILKDYLDRHYRSRTFRKPEDVRAEFELKRFDEEVRLC